MSEGESFYEGLWDCPNCETTSKGSEMTCSGCGTTRPEDVKFYLPEGAQALTEEADIAAAKAGPDWVCGYCDTSNASTASKCKQCAAERAEGTAREQKVVSPEPKPAAAPVAAAPQEGGGGKLILMILAAVVLLGGTGLYFLFRKKTATAQVSKIEWERVIELGEEKWVRETSEVRPTRNARNIRSEQVKRKKKVMKEVMVDKTETIDLGNGKFKKVTKKVPEKKEVEVEELVTEYSFEILKTVPWKTFSERGPPSKPMAWPKTPASSSSKLKEIKRETYFIVAFKLNDKETKELKGTVTSKDKLAPKSIDDLKKYKVGDRYKIEYSKAQGIVAVSKP